MRHVRAVRVMRYVWLLACAMSVGAGCSRDSEPNLGRLPNERARAVTVPMLDAGVAFDFRWVRIAAEPHVGQTRQCDVVFVGAREQVARRIERRYAREVAERLSVRCGAAGGESWIDLVFPPAAIGFASTIHPGQRLMVEVVAPNGGFDDAVVAEFRAVAEGGENATERISEPLSVPAGFDFRQVIVHPELVGRVQPCSISWVGTIRRVEPELRERFPQGASHVLPITCQHTRGDSHVDLVSTARGAPDLLALRRGARIRLRILAARGGASDEPLARLAR
jgi:hypothetical protein